MKVGVLIEGQEGVGWERWREVVRWVEELGFDSLWCSDHLAPLAHDHDGDSLDTVVALTQAATVTSRVHLGTLVSPVTFRHPVTLARVAAALDALSDGRFVLGIGTGWHPAEHEMFGIPLPPPAARVRALEEGATVIRRLATGDRVSVDGAVFRLSGARIRPAATVPLLIGGGGERGTLRVVARHADEWNLPAIPVPGYRRKVGVLTAHCEHVGRDPADIRRSVVLCQAIAATPAAVRVAEKELLAGTPPAYRPGAGPDAPMWLVGTPAQVVEQLHRLADEGVDRVMLQYRRPPSREQLELVAAEVIPHLAGAHRPVGRA